jgi:hypothetical protein
MVHDHARTGVHADQAAASQKNCCCYNNPWSISNVVFDSSNHGPYHHAGIRRFLLYANTGGLGVPVALSVVN